MKKNKGITLIALIVTIIILLILAGISILMLVGENGILNKSKLAKDNSEVAKQEEENRLSQTNEMMENYTTARGESSSGKMVSIYKGTANTVNISYELSDSILNYDQVIVAARAYYTPDIKIKWQNSTTMPVSQLTIGTIIKDVTICYYATTNFFYDIEIHFSDNTHFIVDYIGNGTSFSNSYITDIYGVKL